MAPVAGPFISLLTDFGPADPSVAACKGVILRLCPDARLVDVSHGIPRHSIAHGAAILWSALPYFSAGVHLAIVDPGVGTERRPIGIRTGRGDHLVGPDNGLLLPATERLGGIVAAHLLENPDFQLASVSRTFHGRDIFSPAAAYLACGVALEAFGPPIDPADLVSLPVEAACRSEGALEASVVFVDNWGNVQLLAETADLEAAVGECAPGDPLLLASADGSPLKGAEAVAARWRLTYGEAEPGEPLLYLDSYGRLALAVNRGNASEAFGIEPNRRLVIRKGT